MKKVLEVGDFLLFLDLFYLFWEILLCKLLGKNYSINYYLP